MRLDVHEYPWVLDYNDRDLDIVEFQDEDIPYMQGVGELPVTVYIEDDVYDEYDWYNDEYHEERAQYNCGPTRRFRRKSAP